MVQSAKRPTNVEEAYQYIRRLHALGVPEATLTPVEEAIRDLEEQTPTDLITLEEASERFEVPYGTLLYWLSKGTLVERDRMKFPAPGGGKVRVSAADVAWLKANPPRPGRPKKRQ